jgi:hypothetical protein
MRFTLMLSLVAAASTLAAAGARAADPVPEAAVPAVVAPRTIDGIWILDAEHSDDPMKVMQAARGGGGGGRYGGGREGGGWGGRGGEGGGREGGFRRGGADGPDGGSGEAPGERPRGASPMARVMRPAHKVVIDVERDEVTVAEDERAPRPYALKDSLDAHGRDLVTENTSARWKSGRLEMSESLGPRGSLVETYELSKDGRTLTIRARREGGSGGPSLPAITRVYTRYEGD